MVKVVGREERLVKRTTCSNCASILEYTLNEVESKTYSCCGHLETDGFIKCPNCGYNVRV